MTLKNSDKGKPDTFGRCLCQILFSLVSGLMALVSAKFRFH